MEAGREQKGVGCREKQGGGRKGGREEGRREEGGGRRVEVGGEGSVREEEEGEEELWISVLSSSRCVCIYTQTNTQDR